MALFNFVVLLRARSFTWEVFRNVKKVGPDARERTKGRKNWQKIKLANEKKIEDRNRGEEKMKKREDGDGEVPLMRRRELVWLEEGWKLKVVEREIWGAKKTNLVR
jgi:hypothetical protein